MTVTELSDCSATEKRQQTSASTSIAVVTRVAAVATAEAADNADVAVAVVPGAHASCCCPHTVDCIHN